eukprot:3409900-Prymnesium_polylepis.2
MAMSCSTRPRPFGWEGIGEGKECGKPHAPLSMWRANRASKTMSGPLRNGNGGVRFNGLDASRSALRQARVANAMFLPHGPRIPVRRSKANHSAGPYITPASPRAAERRRSDSTSSSLM